jgi:hypothetical protein
MIFIVSQLKNSLNRHREYSCLFKSRFWDLSEWVTIKIGIKLERGHSKSSILQSINNSIASLELNKYLFSLESAVKSSEIKGSIKNKSENA